MLLSEDVSGRRRGQARQGQGAVVWYGVLCAASDALTNASSLPRFRWVYKQRL